MRDCAQSSYGGGCDGDTGAVVVTAREKVEILDTDYLERLLIEMRVKFTTVCCTIRSRCVCVIERVESSRYRELFLGMDACVELDMKLGKASTVPTPARGTSGYH